MILSQKLNNNYIIKLKAIENKAKELWENGALHHPYYTLHGIKHSNAVIDILNFLVVGLNFKGELENDNELEEIEIFCLLAAAYLHDVGMLCKYSNDEACVKNKIQSEKKHYTVQDLIRDEHHLRSGHYIRENYKILELDYIEAECISLISEGHRKEDLFSSKYDSQAVGFKRVRVRLLSALLKLADELDVDYRRAPEILREILNEDMPNFSKLQWLKHHYTSGLLIGPTVKDGKKILSIEINCHYPKKEEGEKVVEVLILKPIKEKIEELKPIFLDYGLKLYLTPKLQINTNLPGIPEYLLNDVFRENNELNELLRSLDSLKKIKLKRTDWDEESEAWINRFHFQLEFYDYIYATDIYPRASLESSRFNKYLRKQYEERLNDLKSSSNNCLSYSKLVYNAIMRTGWLPNQTLWGYYQIKEANIDSPKELEIVRILIRSKADLDDPQALENMDYDHRLHAIPLFVLDTKHLPSNQLIDFVIGFGNGRRIMKCYEFSETRGKVCEMELTHSKLLAEEFEQMLRNSSLKTVDKFLED